MNMGMTKKEIAVFIFEVYSNGCIIAITPDAVGIFLKREDIYPIGI